MAGPVPMTKFHEKYIEIIEAPLILIIKSADKSVQLLCVHFEGKPNTCHDPNKPI